MSEIVQQSPAPPAEPKEQRPIPHWMPSAVLLLGVLVFALCTWRLQSHPSSFRGHYQGDQQQDIYTLTAGLNFAHYGFLPLKLESAIFRVFTNSTWSREDFYIHNPTTLEVISGVQQTVGIHTLSAQRILPYLVSLTGLIFLTLSLSQIVAASLGGAGRATRWLVPAIVLASPPFIYWAGSLWQWPYNDLFFGLGLWLLLTDRLRGFALMSLVSACFSYTMVPMLFVLGCFKLLIEYRKGSIPIRQALGYAVVFFLAPSIAVGIHLLQNAWYLGGLMETIRDYAAIGLRRAGLETGGPNPYHLAAHLGKVFYSVVWFCGSGLLVLAVVGAVVCLRTRNPWPLGLLCAPMVWQILMHQACMVHAFASRDFVPGILTLGVIGLVYLLQAPRSGLRWGGYALLLLCLLRLPLGAELSQNPVFLSQWQKLVQGSDSPTLLAVLSEGRASSEHRQEKVIIIQELARRGGVTKDEPGYEFVNGESRFALWKRVQGIDRQGVPEALLPEFPSETPAYVDKPAGTDSIKPVRIEVNGTPNRRRALLLNFLFRFV